MADLKFFTFFFALTLLAVETRAAARDGWSVEATGDLEFCTNHLNLPVISQDIEWAVGFSNWYVKFMGQLLASRQISALLFGQPATATDRCLFEMPCFTVSGYPMTTQITGCTNVTVATPTNVTRHGTFDFALQNADGSTAWKGEGVLAKSDGRSYMVFLYCFEDGTKSFAVWSNRPAINHWNVAEIYAFLSRTAVSHGFLMTTTFPSRMCKQRLTPDK